MDKSYVTLEIAKLLKEKGFNEWCEWVYEDHGATHSTIDADFVGHSNSNLESNQYAIPFQSQAQTWLRNRKNVIVIVDYDIVYSKKWDYEIWYDGALRVSSFERYDSYEEALEKGLKEAIDFI